MQPGFYACADVGALCQRSQTFFHRCHSDRVFLQCEYVGARVALLSARKSGSRGRKRTDGRHCASGYV